MRQSNPGCPQMMSRHEHDWVLRHCGETYSGEYLVRYRCCRCNMRRDDFLVGVAKSPVTEVIRWAKILEEHYF